MSTPAQLPAEETAGGEPETSIIKQPRNPKKIGIIAAVIVLVLAVIAAVVVWTVPVFGVRTIEVTGNQHVPTPHVQELTGIAEGDNLVRVDTGEVAAQVVSDPWVDSVTVTRSLPSTIRVEIVERAAVAYTDTADGTTLIDASGVPFVIDAPPPTAINITGDGSEDEQVLAGAVDIAAALPEELREMVAHLHADDEFSYTLVLHDDRRILWGSSTDNANKALAMETVVTQEGQEWNITDPQMVTVR